MFNKFLDIHKFFVNYKSKKYNEIYIYEKYTTIQDKWIDLEKKRLVKYFEIILKDLCFTTRIFMPLIYDQFLNDFKDEFRDLLIKYDGFFDLDIDATIKSIKFCNIFPIDNDSIDINFYIDVFEKNYIDNKEPKLLISSNFYGLPIVKFTRVGNRIQ